MNSLPENNILESYGKPDLLSKLENYEKTPTGSWEYLGFYISYGLRSSITPIDVIPFAGTGGDGIHFGFLTDFGRIKSLDQAPIVCVSPTNDPPIKLVARNLKDFIQLVVTVGDAEFLDEEYENEEEVSERLLELDEDPEIKKNRKKLSLLLKEKYEIYSLSNICLYIEKLRRERNHEISIKTSDGLGIILENKVSKIKNYDYADKNPKKIEKYLEDASIEEKLKFYRDSTYHFILSEDDDKEIKLIIIKDLEKNGFKREAEILKEFY